MRIKSNFRDYYDSVMGHGHDSSLTYTRYRKIIGLDDYPGTQAWTLDGSKGPRYTHISGYDVLVCFCGKLYTATVLYMNIETICKQDEIDYRKYGAVQQHKKPNLVTHVSYDLEQTYRVIHTYVNESKTSTWRRDMDRRAERNKEAINKIALAKVKYLFDDHTTPCFVVVPKAFQDRMAKISTVDEDTISSNKRFAIINPCLKDFQFMRVMDAYTTFQEIEMFLGGLANPEPNMIKISDKVRLEAHGFDNKTSFRKPPSKRR